MPENPLATLARLLGGVVLTQGTLGHQVLGQLLIMDTNEVAMAAAAAVVAGTAGQRSAVGQIALRTVAPALAVRVLLNKQEERLKGRSRRLDARERELIQLRRRLHRRRWRMRHERAPSGSFGVGEVSSVPTGPARPTFDSFPSLPTEATGPASPVLSVGPTPTEAAPAGARSSRSTRKSRSKTKAAKSQPPKRRPSTVSRKSPNPRHGGTKKR